MSTTLPNGLIAIDEGNTAWYSDITANWTLLDQKVGTVNALKPVATSGEYNDLTNKPTIPAAANDGVLTIAVNGAAAGTFTANQAGNATVNIAVPTRTSQLTNDSDFITSDAVPRFATDGEIDALASDFNTMWGA
ncbi:MAG: hypothetical protein II047_06780 [Bacteroidales bacterium]|nr:hypothetical protein [Bacteroidales bacterium]